MGYNLSLLAIKGIDKEEVWERLSLKYSGEAVELLPDGNKLTGGLLKSGWYIVCGKPDIKPCPISAGFDTNTMRSLIEIDSSSMAELSQGSEVVILYVQEHCLLVINSYWQNAVEQWRVSLLPDSEDLTVLNGEPNSLVSRKRKR